MRTHRHPSSLKHHFVLRRNVLLYWLINKKGTFYALVRRRVPSLTPWLTMYPDGITPELVIFELSKQRKMKKRHKSENPYKDKRPPPPNEMDFENEDEYEEAVVYWQSLVFNGDEIEYGASASKASRETASSTNKSSN